jgi:amidase
METSLPPAGESTATDIAAGIAGGHFSAQDAIRSSLARIKAREAMVRAWAHLDPDRALIQARSLDRGSLRGPLQGVPVGIKDVLDTFDMPTQMGSPIYRGYQPTADAAVVALLRAAGAVILGKTVTAEFAGLTPGVTTNPHDPPRTPGGSSSGSAAAVADGMVPLALGTQTGGSVLRPASFCGVIGFKPSFGTINRAGLKFAAESLDTIGLFARTIQDIALGYGVLTGAGAPVPALSAAPRIGLCRTFLWHQAEPETVAAVEGAAAALSDAGAKVEEVTLADKFVALAEDRHIINNVERSRAMAFEWAHHREQISAGLSAQLERGRATAQARYFAALATAEDLRRWLDAMFRAHDALLAPCVDGEAPVGLATTGNPDFQAIWTVLHVPTISLPTARGPNGMPVGVQLIGRNRDDARLLAVSDWVLSRLKGTA